MRQLILFFFFLLFVSQSFAQIYTYKSFKHKEGLHISDLLCITQSNDGLIWIGTGGEDIVTFNGETFEFKEIKENSNFHIRNILFDKNKILFSTKYSGFYSYDLITKKAVKFDLRSILYGDAKLILKDQTSHYFIGDSKLISQKQNGAPKVIFESERTIVVRQYFSSPIGIILFTNQGDFILRNGELMKLDKWLPNKNDNINDYQFGYFQGRTLTFIHQNGSTILNVKLNIKNRISSTIVSKTDDSFLKKDSIIQFCFNKKKKFASVITHSGKIFYLDNLKWKEIKLNTQETIKKPTSFFADNNGDYWITTKQSGLIKISDDAFTQIKNNPLYTNPDNFLLYQFSDGIKILSNSTGKTFIETSPNSDKFKTYNFTTHAIAFTDSTYFLATNSGLRIYDLNATPKLGYQFYRNSSISYISSFENNLYIALSGKGLRIYNIENHTVQKPLLKNGKFPNHIYTSQISENKEYIYFGTNNGIYELSIKTNEAKHLDITSELGYYSGISTKDIYGTCWFTVEKGIVGITKKKEIVVIKDEKYFNSTLFYTMMADDFGNLYIGTNKGITCLKVNSKGEVIRKTLYNEKNNFFGFETNMRSQFKKGKMIYFGTIEGIFQINTELLENLPTPPLPNIQIHREEEEETIHHPDFYVTFSVNNPKINSIHYQYRLDKGDWISIKKNQAFINELSNGTHSIEARATYNGVEFGNINIETFEVRTAFWSSTIFITLLIAGIFILNFIILNHYKKSKPNQLIESKDIDFQFSLTPAILLFTTLSTPLTYIIAKINDNSLNLLLESNLIVTFILAILFGISLQMKKRGKTAYYGLLLKIGLVTILLEYLTQFYVSGAHPYVIIGLIIILSIVPYIFVKTKDVIIFTFIVCITFIFTISLIDQVVYPIAYFVYAISITAFLTVFYAYLKYDSLEKLIFISTIINKGNMPVIAFDKNGVISYVSENIHDFIDTSYDKLMHENIKILNNYIPFDSTLKDYDIRKDFKDGEKYIVPMIDNNHSIKWIEWDFKEFSNDVNLIIGQDVSDKMELENTYELLVQQADDFIFKCDVEGNFKFINNSMVQNLGYTKDELIDTHYSYLVTEKYKQKILNFYNDHFFSKKTTSYFDFPILKKDGEEIWVGQSVTTIFAPGSTTRIDGFIALARDITEIRKKNDLIRKQSESITASINYARRIQHNLQPSHNEFKKSFDDFFIFSRAKDIVSGDFYWMNNVGDNVILVLGDCTGHGVPGSFMTLLGINILNSTILENRIIDPGQILNRIDQKLIQYLPKGQGKNTVNDAMELTVCVFNKNTNELAYACAGSRFLAYENDSFTLYKGDNKHVGDIDKDFLGYNTHFAYFENDFKLYLFSDGFQDQFGGVKDKKFSFRRLIELFEANINLPFIEQERIITKTFDTWIGEAEQTDDVTILAVKVKKK